MSLRDAFTKAKGGTVETDLGRHRKIAERIERSGHDKLASGMLKAASERLLRRARAAEGGQPEPDENTLVEAFGLVREASRRALGLDPFDVQIIAGLAMARGRIAELPTGEGKTLAAVFPAYLHALSGRGVHILTFNDYLARRDAAWMGPAFELLGLTVGCVREGMSSAERRRAYASDVTYASAREAGFDFLRDRLADEPEGLVHRPFHMALVDEADSILIDEARVPLVIAGAEGGEPGAAGALAALVRRLVPGLDYDTDAEHRNVFLTDAGIDRVEAALGRGSLFGTSNKGLLEAVHCALHAEALLRRDVDYVVRGRGIEIVDEFTGRVVEGRHWPDGLQAAVEAKEGLARGPEGRILGTVALQQYFGLYPRLCGMTATAASAAEEMGEFYGLRVVVIPPHVPSVREDLPDAIFPSSAAKGAALLEEVGRCRAAGRPVLVGTASVRESERLAAGLKTRGIPCEVLNARNDEREAAIIARAGEPGAVTISTNMAGRGTDIRLGGPGGRYRAEVAALGGLHVIGTNRHESLRIDRQLRGRAGRQGDPGSSRFFISFEDDIFVRYGLAGIFKKRYGRGPDGGEVPGRAAQSAVAHAQRVIEGQNFEIRRSLREYSGLVERQRRLVQAWRDRLPGADGIAVPNVPPGALEWSPSGIVERTDARLQARGLERFGEERARELQRKLTLRALDGAWSDHLAWIADTRESIHLVSVGGETPLDVFVRAAADELFAIPGRVEQRVMAGFRSLVDKEGVGALEAAELRGPASTWTYLINDDQFGWGLELMKGKNIGLAAGAALYAGPLFVLALLCKRLGRKRGGPSS